MRKVKGFAYDVVKDKEAIDHLGKQHNQSRYILDLIKEDMEGGNRKIKELIEQVLKDKGIR